MKHLNEEELILLRHRSRYPLIPRERCVRRVSKDEARAALKFSASWFETAQERLLTIMV